MDEQLFPGRIIANRFRLDRQLGSGGMGTVWEARHLALEAQIAIKFLNAELSQRQDIRSRFAREATAAARIRSSNVVGVFDSGFTDDGLAFIAMELLHGEDLGRRLARLRTCTLRETCDIITQVARGLARAHAVGIVHRDLKPENLFVVTEDDAFILKILDFGIAKAIEPDGAAYKTETGQVLGTPTYMSPEQALGRSLDSRSDVYSLAVVAYRCLAGRPPFTYAAQGEQIVAVSTRVPPPPSRFNPELPPVIDAWFESALAKDPNARAFQTAVQLAESFEKLCAEAIAVKPRLARARDVPGRGLPGVTLTEAGATLALSAEEVAATVAAPPHFERSSIVLEGKRRGSVVVGVAMWVVALASFGLSRREAESKLPVVKIAPALPARSGPTGRQATSAPAAQPASGPSVSVPASRKKAHVPRARQTQRDRAPATPSARSPLPAEAESSPVPSSAPAAPSPTGTATPAKPPALEIDRDSPW